MSREELELEALAEVAKGLVGGLEVDRAAVLDALAELQQDGRISYLGARERRLRREQAVAALRHPTA